MTAERASRRVSRRALLRGGGAGALVMVGAAGWLAWDNHRLVTTRYEVASERLPEGFDGFRIVQVSDLHSAHFGRGNQRLVEAVTVERPDLIALTGDLVDRRTSDLTMALETARSLRGIAPTSFVTGNHEADSALLVPLLAGLETRGVEVLRTASRALGEGEGSAIRVVGIDDPRFPLAGEDPASPLSQDQRTAQRLAIALTDDADGTTGSPDPFTLLLAHRPEQLDAYAVARADVVLAGHAHGGQVRILGLGGLYAPNQGLLPALTAGMVQSGRTHLVISRGLGNSVAPVRVNDPPEIVTVTLRRR